MMEGINMSDAMQTLQQYMKENTMTTMALIEIKQLCGNDFLSHSCLQMEC